MKSEVQSYGITYPSLWRSPVTGTVILFSAEHEGTVVANGFLGMSSSTLGEHSRGWNMANYAPMAPGQKVILTA